MADRFSRQAAAGLDTTLLSEAEVVIIGCGALGNGVATILAIEGIGKLHLIDPDIVELHNVARQLMFTEKDVKAHKVDALARELGKRNSEIKISVYKEQIGDGQMPIDLFARLYLSHDAILVGCVDNNPTRAYANRFAVEHKYPLVSGGTQGMQGWYSAYVPGKTNCLDCVKDIYSLAQRRPQRAPCAANPNPAVAETSLLIAAGMANLVRKIVAPIDEDDAVPKGIVSVDLHMNAINFADVPKKEGCKC